LSEGGSEMVMERFKSCDQRVEEEELVRLLLFKMRKLERWRVE